MDDTFLATRCRPSCLVGVLAVALMLSGPATHAASAANGILLDFEQGLDMAAYPMVSASDNVRMAIVPRPDGRGHCLQLRNVDPSVYCQVTLETPFRAARDLVLSVEHRETIDGGEGAYVGIRLTDEAGHPFLETVRFSDEWKTTVLPVGLMKSTKGGVMTLGLPIQSLHVYGRAKGSSRDPGVNVRMTVWIDNVRVEAQNLREPHSAGTRRISYNNPPMFDWKSGNMGPERLQYSTAPAFPPDKTVTVELDRSYYTPPEPLGAGPWFYRHWIGNELQTAWSAYSEIAFAEEVHHYRAPRTDMHALASASHPRFLPLALADRERPDDRERQALVDLAKKHHDRGIPEDPPPLDLGSGRWKNRVDWIRTVAGPYTMRTGKSLEIVGRAAVLSRDETAIARAREMLLALTRTWDPEGGSSMRANDLHSGQLLRGMVWCYDAAWQQLTAHERREVQANLVTRTEQFYRALNPLRGDEAQNHTWNKASTVGVAALALAGEVKQADEWLDCMISLYAYRFLPSMGFQGDNQEGVAYWAYGVGLMTEFTEPVYHVAGVNLYDHPWLAATGRFPVICAPIGGYIVPLGDIGGESNHGRQGPIGRHLAGFLGRRTHDPYAMWYGGVGETVDGVEPRPPVDIPQSTHFRHIDWVVFNTTLTNGPENVMVGMRSGVYFAGHQHADNNHFFINAYGDKLAVDGGYYDWYGSPHFKEYSVQSLAHNTILVNGKGQIWRAEGGDGDITVFHDSPAYGYTVGDASNPRIYGGALKRFDRRLLFLKPHFLIVHDLIGSARGPARLDWLLHSHTAERIAVDAADASFRIDRPGAELHGRFLVPVDLDMRVARSYDPTALSERKSSEPRKDLSSVTPEWSLWATPERQRVRESFLAVMQINRRDQWRYPEADFERIRSDNAIGVTISHGDSACVVLMRTMDATGPMSGGDVSANGEAAVVEVDGQGEVTRAFLARGTSIAFQGDLLHTSATPVNWAWDGVPQPATQIDSAAWFEFDGERQPMNGAVRHLPNAGRRTWWASFAAPVRCRANLTLSGWDGRQPFVLLDGRRIEPDNEREHVYRVQLDPGDHVVTVNGIGELGGVSLARGTALQSVEAIMLPETFRPSGDAIVIEAENPVREGPDKGKIWEKVGASAGKANCAWEKAGIWAEWTVEVERTGAYEALVRHCARSDPVVRDMSLDGDPIGDVGGLFSFAPTGGWSRTENDWRYFVLATADGEPLSIHLERGAHTLRMESVDTPFNTDCFVFRPAR